MNHISIKSIINNIISSMIISISFLICSLIFRWRHVTSPLYPYWTSGSPYGRCPNPLGTCTSDDRRHFSLRRSTEKGASRPTGNIQEHHWFVFCCQIWIQALSYFLSPATSISLIPVWSQFTMSESGTLCLATRFLIWARYSSFNLSKSLGSALAALVTLCLTKPNWRIKDFARLLQMLIWPLHSPRLDLSLFSIILFMAAWTITEFINPAQCHKGWWHVPLLQPRERLVL